MFDIIWSRNSNYQNDLFYQCLYEGKENSPHALKNVIGSFTHNSQTTTLSVITFFEFQSEVRDFKFRTHSTDSVLIKRLPVLVRSGTVI